MSNRKPNIERLALVTVNGNAMVASNTQGEYVRYEDHEMLMEAKQISWDILHHSYKEMRRNAIAFGWKEREDGSDD